MEIADGALIEWQDLEEGHSELRIDRVLRVNKVKNYIVTIALDRATDDKPRAIKRTFAEIADALALDKARLMESEIFPELLRAEKDIRPAHRARRDKWRAFLAPLIDTNSDEYLLDSRARGQKISELASMKGEMTACKATIYKQYRRFLQSGLSPNAFLPSFNNCGGPGKRRVAKRRDQPKTGRPSALGRVAGHAIGICVTEEVERKFERGTTRFYKDELSLRDAFDKTLGEFFYAEKSIVNGERKSVLLPPDQRPTFNQFRYWYENVFREADPVKEEIRREGKHKYNLESRPTLGDPTELAFNPGALYQIDSTISDINIVNSLDPLRITGHPVTYACMDVFSHAGAGICVTLERPSWVGAMLALDAVMANKVEFCAEYGIQIEESEWPIQGFPQAICADRGEFEGYDATSLVTGLHIRVDNTAPYRADWKFLVERQFGLLNQRCINFLPGRARRAARGEPDSRLGAMLTMHDFRQAILLYMLDYNQNFYLADYRKDEFMIAEHVERYPLDIWNWGVVNRGTSLKPRSRDHVRLNLLPRRTVSITGSGIHFEKQLFYTCERAEREQWFARANLRDSWTMEAAHDPRTTNAIYLITDGGTKIERCHLTLASRHLKGRDWVDICDYIGMENQAKEVAEFRRQQASVTLHDKQDVIISRAAERKEQAMFAAGKISKSVLVSGIRENRAEEWERERAAGIWNFGPTEAPDGEGKVTEEAGVGPEQEQSYAAPSNLTLLQQQREERWKETKND